MSSLQRVFALTICAYRKPGMDEEEYHRYMSERHAASVTDLMVQKKIIAYTMVRSLLPQLSLYAKFLALLAMDMSRTCPGHILCSGNKFP